MSRLKLTSTVLNSDLPSVETRIRRFIADYVNKCRSSGVVLGVSGGVDSCTTAALSSLALGGHRVLGIMLHEEETYNATDIEHAKTVAEKFDFNLEIIDLSSVLRACFRALHIYEEADKVSKGNLKARMRMVFLYYYGNILKRIVCGSSDKSETMIGYFTKWGDVAADISPLMDLYKTQVRQLALHIGIPAEIAQKPSTPRLWPGQLAEDELGIKYETLDLILFGLERFMTPQEIANQLKLPLKRVEEIRRRWLSSEHKRRAPLTTKLAFRTVGADFRLPYTMQ
ncbi:MAG: NAD+ synthase [Candidatus Bathyarchaeota archaeon]|nr:MAG: NAD+ synthase [Candidatus Bathyarchaeota archaeon]